MADVVDKMTRSRMMSGIRAKNTRPEIAIRTGLHALGYRYRLHVKEIPGSPDIVLPKFRALVIVQGCYWHGHNCRFFKLPGSNVDFWRGKISANQMRDQRNLAEQRKAGWRTLVVWECAVRSSLKKNSKFDIVGLVASWISSESSMATIDESGIREG